MRGERLESILEREFERAIDNILKLVNVRNAVTGAKRIKQHVKLLSEKDFALGYLTGFLWGTFEFSSYTITVRN